MSKLLRERFASARAEGRPLFLPYVTAGYPTPDDTVPILLELEAAGADIIEIGVPFTDPLADGATIQHANQVALEQGVTLGRCFDYVREARTLGLTAPVLLMGYYNPILAAGEERVPALARAAGVDGFIVVDLPQEEAAAFRGACAREDITFVPLVSPTTADERIPALARAADTFLYCVSVTGTTGSKSVDTGGLPAFLNRVRAQTDLPLVVGFGISRREHIEAIGKIAEGAAVGTAIIAAIDRRPAGTSPAEAVGVLARELSGR